MKDLRLKLLLVCSLSLLLGTHVYTSAAAVPANDDCSNATPIGEETKTFDTTEATFDGPGHYITGPNIWYCYTATCTGVATVSLCGSEYDTLLAVYDGCNCYPTSDDLIEYNDDFCNWASQVSFPVVAGNKYLIEVGGFLSETGLGVIRIICGQSYPPSNDNCFQATPVGDVTDLPFDTTNATFDGHGHCMTGPNIWYCYTATCTGTATVSLCGSEYDTMLAVYDGCECYPGLSDLIGYSDDYCDLQSLISFAVVAGHRYLIEVGGYENETGQGVMSISCSGQPAPPLPNDNCYHAAPIGNVANLAFSTINASFDGPGHCMRSPNIWYCYTATCTGNVTVSLCGSRFDTKLAVYSGCTCYPSKDDLIECNDDFCNTQSQITFAAVAGNQYLIEVGGYDYKTGFGVISVNCEGLLPEEFDLGDAPDSTNNLGAVMTAYAMAGPSAVQANFPTVFNDGSGVGPVGPLHRQPRTAAHLGKNVTTESEADIGPDEDGLNNINPKADSADKDGADDGVILPASLPHGQWAKFDYYVNVIKPGTDLWVNVWCDWNRDGDWDDTLADPKGQVPEWAVQNQYLFNLPAGTHKITTPAFLCWHPTDGPEAIWMRVSLSEQPFKGGENPGKLGNGGSGPKAGYEFGETEDYYFVADTTAPSCLLCQDLNGDGKVDLQDLVILVSQWLASCP